MNYPEKGTIGIYKITSPSGRIYIGQSICIANRWYHYKMLDCKSQPKLHNSFIKYTIGAHIFEVVEICLFEELNIRERYWQDFYTAIDPNIGLNCVLTETNVLPKRLSQETKDKIGKANGGDNHWTKHKPITDQHRLNSSKGQKGKKMGEDNYWFGKFGALHHSYGKKHSPETRKKLSDSHMGNKHSDETRQKMKESHKNKQWSEEVIEKRNQTRKNQTVILNLETGIYYMGYEEAAETLGINTNLLARRLKGELKNKTSFVLCYTKNKVYL